MVFLAALPLSGGNRQAVTVWGGGDLRGGLRGGGLRERKQPMECARGWLRGGSREIPGRQVMKGPGGYFFII